jgi:hypothetical protein
MLRAICWQSRPATTEKKRSRCRGARDVRPALQLCDARLEILYEFFVSSDLALTLLDGFPDHSKCRFDMLRAIEFHDLTAERLTLLVDCWDAYSGRGSLFPVVQSECKEKILGSK